MRVYIKRFSEISIDDLEEVGIKNAWLGELGKHMAQWQINMPPGFAVTTAGFDHFLASNALERGLTHIMAGLDTKDFTNLEATGAKARKLVMSAKFPSKLESAISEAYIETFKTPDQGVAIKSSLDKDYTLDGSSIYETHLNIKGHFALVYAIKCCFASVFNDVAIKYRVSKGMRHTDIRLSIGIQKMVRSDLACSGTGLLEPSCKSGKNIKISGVWGLGTEPAHASVPDEYRVRFTADEKVIVSKKMGDKSSMLVNNEPAAGINTTNLRITPPELRGQFTLGDSEAVEVAKLTCLAQLCFDRPVVIKWAKDGVDQSLQLIGITAQDGIN